MVVANKNTVDDSYINFTNKFRYGFLLNCWIRDPKVRPSFSDLVPLLSQSLEAMVGYMDVTAFKKYADNSSTVKASSSEDKNGQSGHLSSHGNRCTETVM